MSIGAARPLPGVGADHRGVEQAQLQDQRGDGMSEGDQPAENTDRELYREPKGDLPSDYYANSLFVTAHGAIGMNVGGSVVVQPIADWHALAVSAPPKPFPAPTTPDHPVSPAHGDPGLHSEGQDR